MTRILVQRGSSSSSSNATRPPSSSSSQQQDKDLPQDPGGPADIVEFCSEDKTVKNDEVLLESPQGIIESEESADNYDVRGPASPLMGELSRGCLDRDDSTSSGVGPSQIVSSGGTTHPPPPPVPPPKPSAVSTNLGRTSPRGSNSARIGGCSRRPPARSVVSTRSSPSSSRPSSPRSLGEGEGYNSADEQSPGYVSLYVDAERERLFELDIRRTKGFEVKRMLEDGNCLFRAVADQVYGDPESCDMVRQMCIDYMERERDHFSQFITEGFASYCRRKRRDKVYGNNVEIQAFAEMYNRPIRIYSYSTEPINTFHGSYDTDTPPIRLSYHHGNHYNSLVDPRRLTIGSGLGFSGLQGTDIDKYQVKAAIKAQQDQQIDNALLAEGRFYSDLELTEKEIERMVLEASRAEYLAEDKLKLQCGFRESSISGAEPSSSGATGSSHSISEGGQDKTLLHSGTVLSSSLQMVLSMGFSYMQVIEAYSIFGDDVDSMVCYLLDMAGSGASPGGSSRRKGKAAE